MMNYEIFKEVVMDKLCDYLPEGDYSIEIRQLEKVNEILDGIMVMKNGAEDNIAPAFYLNNMYEEYQQSEDLQSVLQQTANFFIEAEKKSLDIEPKLNLETAKAKDNIIMMLVNTEQNKEMLADMPNRSFQDLSIIYLLVVDVSKGEFAKSMIHDSLARQLGMNEEQLFQAAVLNTERIFPPTVMNMNQIMMEIMMGEGMPPEMAEIMMEEIPPEQSMYVISNSRKLNGAVSMLYEEHLHQLAEKLETDFYILPSSIHEVIAIPAGGDPNELAQMVSEVNMNQVSLEERLSNQVYHYDKDLRKLSLATDTPNKRLDGKMAEAELIYKERDTSR